MNNINDVKTNIQQATEPQLDLNPEPDPLKNNSETQNSDTKNFSNSEKKTMKKQRK